MEKLVELTSTPVFIKTFKFGKHKGKEVEFVFKKEPGYYSWILKGDFSQNTKSCFTKLWEEFKSKT